MDLSIEQLWEQNNFTPNENQEKAIRHTAGPLYLPAGPGSGKTRVLLWRTLNLIVFHNVNPDQIYLSTFTEKAAHQLVEGIRTYLSQVTKITGQPYDISRMYVGTIHSLCNRIITDRRFSSNQERKKRPSLLDDIAQYFYLSRTWRWRDLVCDVDLRDGLEDIYFAINQYFGKNTQSRHQAVINCIALFNRFSEECLDPNQVIGKTDDGNLLSLLCMYEHYLELLEKGEVVPRTDFSLMQRAAFDILEESPGSGDVFKHVIIDEYQDTNTIQEKLIFKLGSGSKNICVVGDDDQALYRFRGATVENFVNFPEKCFDYLQCLPNVVALDTNYRSRKPIVNLYSDFMSRGNWTRSDNPNLLYRFPKNIQPHRKEEGPAVVATNPGHPDTICHEIALFVKQLLDSGKVENANQIAFLFPSLKTDKVGKFKTELESLGLKVYAPRAGSFLHVEEAVSVFGVFLHIFGKFKSGHYPGHDYKEYIDWLDGAYSQAEGLVSADVMLKQFVHDLKEEIKIVKADFTLLKSFIESRRWQLDLPYNINEMKRPLQAVPGLSERAVRNIRSQHFDKFVIKRQQDGRPISLSYVLTRATSLDWTVLDLFYRLCTFDHFKQMFDLAEEGIDEGPICNMGLISQYLSRFMDLYKSIITGQDLMDDKYANWLFGSFLYALHRLGESEYENPDDPFPKGRIPFLTIHQAKGLEFPVVVFANPRKASRGVQKVEAIIHPLIERQGEPIERMPEFDMMRLFYVALSRAKNLLVIPHWSASGSFVSQPLRDLLDEKHITRLPEYDLSTLPEAKLEKTDLPKNYSYTGDYLTYKKCPRQYMIFRKYGFVPSRSQTMFFGNLVHQTLEDLHHYLIAKRAAV